MAWFDDLNLPGATVDGHFGYVIADGPDDDDNPDVLLASGTVTFTATTPAARVDGAWLGIQTVTAEIFEGRIVAAEEDLRPIRLLATDANIGVADWAWKATFDIKGFTLAPLTFKAPRGTTVNLTADLIPIKSQPYQIIEGASIVDAEVSGEGTMRFVLSDDSYTKWIDVPNGERGPRGERGPNGEDGAPGKAATLAMGAVSAGSSADAWMTGTPSERQLNLVIPRGSKGERGDVGATGPLAKPKIIASAPGEYDVDSDPTSIAVTDVDGLAARLAALEYDSGERDITSRVPDVISGRVLVWRLARTVHLTFDQLVVEVPDTPAWLTVAGLLPVGFRGAGRSRFYQFAQQVGSRAAGPIRVDASGSVVIYNAKAGNGRTLVIEGTVAFPTLATLPTTQPGDPA